MFMVDIDENKALLIADAVKADYISDTGCAVFYNDRNAIVGMYKLNEIKGFYKGDYTNKEGKIFFRDSPFNSIVKC